jgi:hypothetical protein
MNTTKKPMTEKQKAARTANLEKARAVRAEKKKNKILDYPSSDEDYTDDSESSDNDAFVISKKKPSDKNTKLKMVERKSRKSKKQDIEYVMNDVDELKNMVYELAALQKKQQKSTKRKSRGSKSGGTNIVVVPQNQHPSQGQSQTTQKTNQVHDSILEALRKSLM